MKKYLSLCVFFVFGTLAFSQVSVEINDFFYKQAQIWELRGLTTTLPQIRPYPVNVIKRILDDVIENGSEKDAELAKGEYERIFQKSFSPYFKATGGAKISHEENDFDSDNSVNKDFHTEVGIGGDVILHDLVSVGYKFGIYAQKNEFSAHSQLYTSMEEDSIFDPVDAGPLTAYLNWNMNVAVGNQSVYGTGGMNRLGFGPFIADGLALNDAGYHSANLTFNATTEKWSYASAYETIGATRNMGAEIDSSWLDSGKYLAFHAIKWHAFEKFNLTYYENIIFGPYNNLSYITPAPYYAVQNIGGANDNLQMGLLFEVKPVKGLDWATDFFADDIELNEVLKFNFDTKLRFGFQTGIVYAPEESLCERLTFNYTAVMPYVYAHWQYDDSRTGAFDGKTWNRQNYTNSGVNIGSALDPNSDKISLTAQFAPAKNLKLNLFGNFIRHANGAEDFSDDEAAEYMLAKKGTYATNGTLYMTQMFADATSSHGKHVDSAWKKLGFMTSDHKMYVTQLGLNAEYSFARTKYGKFSLCAGYTFEYVKNNGVNAHIYKGGLIDDLKITTTEDGKYKIGGGSTEYTWDELKQSKEVQTAVNAARENWVSQLYDSLNHYISVSMKYSY
ncbi:hypothetical protein [uncultured Treponema sp.]|uniref:hypothetical protein n=1 Tax=uncultured Treponema sp. TaxID=162155 RepID=UPI0025E5CEFC|nr:hypothetical protein [uncultured Treponema sp.]